jgi:cell division protein FtsI (penicillin-binding protein 3)
VRGWRQDQEADPGRGNTRTANRLLGLAVLALLWAILICSRLVYLQVVRHQAYLAAADRQQHTTFPIDAPRGTIFDRSGHPLALSVPVDSVCLNPLQVPDRPVAADILAYVLGVDRQDLLARMNRAVDDWHRLGKKARGTGFLWIKRKITPEESERLRSLKLDYIEFRTESERCYPDGSLVSHIVGTVDYREKGNLGIEQSLDGELSGRPGKVRMLTDVRRRGIESLDTEEAEPGLNITLSIDERIQYVAQRELEAACRKYNAASGSVVVMNPYNGEILALVSYPGFDPNRPPLTERDRRARFDYPVSVPFEPGSVFKIVTLSAALETTHLRPDSLINCGNGAIRLFGRVIHESHHGFGTISMAEVLAKSSNIGAIQIALKVGERNLLKYVRRFGFGERTGIPMPAESSGTVRDLKHWGKTSIGSVAMGHEVSATGVQLAQACSVIANGGVLVRPRLVLKQQRPGEKPVTLPLAPQHRVLKPETAITMRRLMEGVVLKGTGMEARLQGYSSGGKTGSAQIFDRATHRYLHLYNGSFVGFAPVTNPAVVVAVTLNGTKMFGGVVAAPVFRVVAGETLRLLEVPRDLPDTAPEPVADPSEIEDVAIAGLGEPPDDLADVPEPPPAAVALTPAPAPAQPPHTPAVLVTLGPTVPSFEGKTVRAVLQESLAAGLQVDVVGSGIARSQSPAAGAVVNPGERVRVMFQ